jgi:hypothetical protein
MFDRSFNWALFDAHDGSVRSCCAVPQSNDCQTVAGHEASGGKSTESMQLQLHARVWTKTQPHYDDRPFIVLTETKFSSCCIPVWIGTLLTGLGSKKNTCDNVLTMPSKVPW